MGYIEFADVYKIYKSGSESVKALDGVSFTVEQGELCVVVGPSGAGKTTLLNVLGGMDRCSDGQIAVDDKIITDFNKRMLMLYRRQEVGFIFQSYNLVPNLTAVENLELVANLSDKAVDCMALLRLVGLEDRATLFPSQLSGGEQQRVAIARALVKKPKLLLCDEPTGALDYETGIQVLKLIKKVSEIMKMTVLIITHNSAIAPIADRVLTMKSGKISKIEINETPMPIERIEW
ncbi:MAG: ABC transporter ATP-binding protein [Acutalibacteraceae bacterium]|nr:ABC transporter ATP-binding protein [Acutalibacteraceae bacterium]